MPLDTYESCLRLVWRPTGIGSMYGINAGAPANIEPIQHVFCHDTVFAETINRAGGDLLRSFFFSLNFFLVSYSHSLSSSLQFSFPPAVVVTRIRVHMASSFPSPPTTTLRAFLFYREKTSAPSPLVGSRRFASLPTLQRDYGHRSYSVASRPPNFCPGIIVDAEDLVVVCLVTRGSVGTRLSHILPTSKRTTGYPSPS